MGKEMTLNFWQQLMGWFGSIPGILTILIVAITATRMIMSGIREKRGSDSAFYRNAKTLATMTYVILLINGIGMLFGSIKGSVWSMGEAIFSANWSTVIALTVIYVAACYFAGNHDRIGILWIATVICIAVAQVTTQDVFDKSITGFTWVVGFITVFISVAMSCALADGSSSPQQPNSTDEASGKKRKNILLAICWLGSMTAAYLAGEYNLIPKVVELVQEKARKIAEERELKKAEEAAKAAEKNAENAPSD